MLIVGRITRAHGLRGEVVVDLLGEESRLAPASTLHTNGGVLTVVSARPHQNRWVVAFEGVSTREAADALRGTELRAEPIDVAGALWLHDLLGATAVDPGGEVLGTIAAVVPNPAADLLELVERRARPDDLRGRLGGRRPRRPPPRRRPAGGAAGARVSEPEGRASDRHGSLRVDVFTIFPALVDAFAGASLLGRARAAGLVDVRLHDLREHTTDVHRSVDDTPYGGGAGMVLRPEPLFAAVEAVDPPRPLLLLGPGGRRFDQAFAAELAAGAGFSLLCGRYEGVDARVADHLCDGELSIGDYVARRR